ncbi:MAG: class I SAM-dependent methyltransferase [Promethearchaeota archaeon]
MLDLKSYWRKRRKNQLLKGKISWLEPHKIAKQSILILLIDAKKYARGRLLDVGCGDKPYELIFADAINDYIGMDLPISESANKLEKQVDVYGSALDFPLKSNSFDAVLSTEVIEHLPEPKKMLKEAYRVLKNGGYLILTAPMTWGLHEIPHDYYRYTKYGLKYLAESVGFEVVYIKESCGFWGVIGQRLSGYTYYWRGAPKTIVGEVLKRNLCAVIQMIYNSLDRINKNKGETLDCIIVAKKVKK